MILADVLARSNFTRNLINPTKLSFFRISFVGCSRRSVDRPRLALVSTGISRIAFAQLCSFSFFSSPRHQLRDGVVGNKYTLQPPNFRNKRMTDIDVACDFLFSCFFCRQFFAAHCAISQITSHNCSDFEQYRSYRCSRLLERVRAQCLRAIDWYQEQIIRYAVSGIDFRNHSIALEPAIRTFQYSIYEISEISASMPPVGALPSIKLH